MKIKDYIVDCDADVAALTETWLSSENNNIMTIGDLCPNGYILQHIPRQTGRGGGTGLLHKDSLHVKLHKTNHYTSFEYSEYFLKMDQCIRLIVVYRPPPTKPNKLKTSQFFDEFPHFLEQQVVSTGHLLIVGDFNFHIDDSSNYEASRFMQLLECFNLQQHVKFPTHKNGHILDLIITRKDDAFFNLPVTVSEPDIIADHSAVHLQMCFKKPDFRTKKIFYRKLQGIDHSKLKTDIEESVLCQSQVTSLKGLVQQYDYTLNKLLDKHAPIKHTTVTIRPAAPWYTDEIRAAKRKRRKLERKWRNAARKGDEIKHEYKMDYKEQCLIVSELLVQSKIMYYNKIIEDNSEETISSCEKTVTLEI